MRYSLSILVFLTIAGIVGIPISIYLISFLLSVPGIAVGLPFGLPAACYWIFRAVRQERGYRRRRP